MNKKIISEVMGRMSSIGHKKKPRSKKFYQDMQKKSVKKRLSKATKKLSTDTA